MNSNKRPKIIISLTGGLGNQMFQYALYRYLSQKNLNVFIDNHFYNKKSLLHHEIFKLDYFNIKDINYISLREVLKYIDLALIYNLKTILELNIGKLILIKCIFTKIIRKFLKLFHYKYQYRKTFFREDPKNGPYIVEELDSSSNIYLSGNFTYYSYVESIRHLLKNDFTFNKVLPESIIALLAEIQRNKSVAIHIRRGDYVGDRVRDVCSMAYYRNSIQYLSAKYNDLFYYIFSDDIEYVKANFFFLEHYSIIDNSSFEISDYYDLFLMTQVNHLIISNSTFSWWAAWLNSNPKKTVIAPERYHMDNSWVKSSALYPPEWIKLAIN